MANRYLRSTGGNWTDAGTWEETEGGGESVTAPTASDDVFFVAGSGQCTISAASVGKSLNCTGYTGTLTHNAFSLTISGSITLVAGMTYTPLSTSTLVLSGTGTLTTGGKLIPNFTKNGGGTGTLGDNLAFMAAKTLTLQVVSTSFDINGNTVSGNSETNRVLIRSNTLGTAFTVTNALATTFNNVDFRDITFTSAGALDLTNAGANSIGDCGGNTASGGTLTMTTAATQTYTGGTGSWSDVTKWTSRVPLPQDNVLMSGVTGGTITADMPRLGKSIDWTGASGTPTWTNSISVTSYGSITLISAMTQSGANTWNFEGRGSFTLTSAGKTFSAGAVAFAMVGGTMTLQDAFIQGSETSGSQITFSNGTFDSNGFNVSANQFTLSGTTTRSVLMRNSTWTGMRGGASSSGTPWGAATTTNLTFDAGTSTISFTNVGANAMTFAGGGLTYNNFQTSGGGAGAVIITGANTFNRIYTDGGGTKSITLPGSTTTTIISGQGLNNGTNLITFTASAGSATVSKSSGAVGWDYVSLTNIPSTGGATFYAGANSTDGGGNTGWIFSASPAGSGFGLSDGNKNDNVNVYPL